MGFYERLGLPPEEPVDTFRLARKLLGPEAIVRGTSIVGMPAKLFVVNGERRIAVNRRLAIPYAQFYVGHELGHVLCSEIGYVADDLEAVCDHLGAALMAPLPAVRAMLKIFGRDHEAIADEVGSTQTWAALRIAEFLAIPRAVVTPKKLYVRGPETWQWASEPEVRRLARVERPGVSKVRLTDDPRRVLIDIDDRDAG